MHLIKKSGGSRLAFLLLVAFFLFWFFLTKDNFFHWDEWHFLMSFHQSIGSFLTKPYGEHYLPLNLLNHYLFFRLFDLNNLPFQISLIFWHLFNSFLLYKIILIETSDKKFALLGMILFGVSNVYNEDVIWSQGISSVGSATLISLAFLSLLNFQQAKKVFWLFLSAVSLLLSPLFNAFGTLAPFAFVLISFLKMKETEWIKMTIFLFLSVGIINLFVLLHFSGNQITNSTQKLSLISLVKIPEFILSGVIRGNIIRFFFPGLHLLAGQQQFKSLFFLAFTLLTAVLFIKYLIDWLKNLRLRFERIASLVSYLSLVTIGYFAAAIGRASYGPVQAEIARYTYQSFFFLITLALIILKGTKIEFHKILVVAMFFWALNLYSLVKFENEFWKKMVARDRQFVADVSYLFRQNQTIYDISAKGIYPTAKLSEFWFLQPPDKQLSFIDGGLQLQNIFQASNDLKSQEIYRKLLTDYQKKYD